jgi:hypothetical protein
MAYCLGGTFEACLDGAGCGLTCRPAAAIVAGGGLKWPGACGRWLPVWFPGISLAMLMFEHAGTWDPGGSGRLWSWPGVADTEERRHQNRRRPRRHLAAAVDADTRLTAGHDLGSTVYTHGRGRSGMFTAKASTHEDGS